MLLGTVFVASLFGRLRAAVVRNCEGEACFADDLSLLQVAGRPSMLTEEAPEAAEDDFNVLGCPAGWREGVFVGGSIIRKHMEVFNATECLKYAIAEYPKLDYVIYSRYRQSCDIGQNTSRMVVRDLPGSAFWVCPVGPVSVNAPDDGPQDGHDDTWWHARHCEDGWEEGAWGADVHDAWRGFQTLQACFDWAVEFYGFEGYVQFEQIGGACKVFYNHWSAAAGGAVQKTYYRSSAAPDAKAWRCKLMPGPDPSDLATTTTAPFHWPTGCSKVCDGGWHDDLAVVNGRVLGHFNSTGQRDCFSQAMALYPDAQYLDYTTSNQQCMVKQHGPSLVLKKLSDIGLPIGFNHACVVGCSSSNDPPPATTTARVPPTTTARVPPATTTARVPPTTTARATPQCKEQSFYCEELCSRLGGRRCVDSCSSHRAQLAEVLGRACASGVCGSSVAGRAASVGGCQKPCDVCKGLCEVVGGRLACQKKCLRHFDDLEGLVAYCEHGMC